MPKTTNELDHKYLVPNSIAVEGNEVVIRMPLLDPEVLSGTGKMEVLCTTNGWMKTSELCPRTSKPITVQIFVGTKK